MKIKTVKDFYTSMQHSSVVRRRIVRSILGGRRPEKGDVGSLRSLLAALTALPQANGALELKTEKKYVSLELNYEITELEKDLIFLQRGENALLSHMDKIHTGFQEELARALEFCRSFSFPIHCLISDRDGTVNNYCGRYLSSIQSAYNAVFLSRFAQRAVRKAVILTSAPLSGGGLEELTVAPRELFILAGSKGREYLDREGRRGALPIEPDKQEKLNRLNRQLSKLLREPRNELFSLVGSGLQFKFGQTTVARQDIYGSISETESGEFMCRVEELVRGIDPRGEYFRTEDTGKDIEIILTVEGESGLKDFDKGDGVRFLDGELDLGLAGGGNLVCGDTSSDISMVVAAFIKSPETSTIFVSGEETLKEAVGQVCGRAHFVSEPDVLVCLLNQLGKEGK